ncbi:unnamed protein product [Ceutorhynchus assimilis]|uniref:Endonuclease/exonuclease/phosphatase domain-containing protein n=1 Tax=Ceutorhynchus assimilis TaxID=467358 RepID=A0A9N9MAB6_9CUCU|nr:unnamed protein product [Ceutorhynchus assimilis]
MMKVPPVCSINSSSPRKSSYEDISVPRCFRCQKHFHKNSDCSNKITCEICADEHDFKECPQIRKQCVNCIKAKSKYNVNHNIGYTANDPLCLSLQYLLQIQKSKIVMACEQQETSIMNELDQLQTDIQVEAIDFNLLHNRLCTNNQVFNVLHLNIRSIRKNLNDFLAWIQSYKLNFCNIIVLSECWRGARLDHIFVRRKLNFKSLKYSAFVLDSAITDHYPVMLNISRDDDNSHIFYTIKF